MPFLRVGTQSGSVYLRARAKFPPDDTLLPGEEATEVERELFTVPFHCDNPIPRCDGTEDKRLDFESRAFKLLAGGSVPSETLSGTRQWSDYAGSDPVAAVTAQGMKIARTVGKMANVLVVSEPVFFKLRNHPKIRNGFPSPAALAQAYLRNLFDVDNFLVADSRIWNNDVLRVYVPPKPGVGVMAFGYTFVWQGQYDIHLIEPEAGLRWINAIQ